MRLYRKMKEKTKIKIRLITVIFISFLGIIIKPVDFKENSIGYTVITITYLITLLCSFAFLVLNFDNYSKEYRKQNRKQKMNFQILYAASITALIISFQNIIF